VTVYKTATKLELTAGDQEEMLGRIACGVPDRWDRFAPVEICSERQENCAVLKPKTSPTTFQNGTNKNNSIRFIEDL